MVNYQKPYTFRSGNYAKAKEVNANFDTLQDYVNDLTQTLSEVEFESTPYNKANVNGDDERQFEVADATASNQAVNKGQLDSAVSALETSIADTNLTVTGNYTTLSGRITALENTFSAPDYSSYSTFEYSTGTFANAGVLVITKSSTSNLNITLGTTTITLVGQCTCSFPVAIGTSYDLSSVASAAKFFPNVS